MPVWFRSHTSSVHKDLLYAQTDGLAWREECDANLQTNLQKGKKIIWVLLYSNMVKRDMYSFDLSYKLLSSHWSLKLLVFQHLKGYSPPRDYSALIWQKVQEHCFLAPKANRPEFQRSMLCGRIWALAQLVG